MGTWLVTNNKQFVNVKEAHHWQMCYRRADRYARQ